MHIPDYRRDVVTQGEAFCGDSAVQVLDALSCSYAQLQLPIADMQAQRWTRNRTGLAGLKPDHKDAAFPKYFKMSCTRWSKVLDAFE